MSTITFDTLKFVERLEKAGVPREQATAMAEAQREVFSETLDNTLATKADIARLDNNVTRLEAQTKTDMAALRSEIQAMEMRLTIKLGAFLAVAVGFMLTVLKMH